MPATLIGSNTYAFADGNAGHVIDLGSAPSVGQTDVLCVNSDTVVTTPSGFSLDVSRVNSQGAYVYTRKAVGGETQNVTITTSGDHNTAVSWLRWGSLNAKDNTANSGVDGVAGTSSPSHTTGTLTASTELILAFAALHSLGAVPSSPVWANSYTGQTATTQGTGSTGVANYVGYKQPVGTAAESPSVSWTGNVSDRYMLTITFTITGGLSFDATTATETDTAGTFGRRHTRALGIATEVDTAQTFGRRHTRSVGVAAETDTSQTLGRIKTRSLGIASQTDIAQTLGRVKTRAVGIAGESDTAPALSRIKTRSVGIASQADTAVALTRVKTRALGVASQADLARGFAKSLGINKALETDSAVGFGVTGTPEVITPGIFAVLGPVGGRTPVGPTRGTAVVGALRATCHID